MNSAGVYITGKEKAAIQNPESFQHLLGVALKVLSRIRGPVVQVCGPMSTGGAGTLQKNMVRFKIAVALLSKNFPFNVFDQTPFQDGMVKLSAHLPPDVYCMEILEVFYRGVFESGLVGYAFFLPDWQSSKGARWEYELMKTLPHIAVADYPRTLYREVLELEKIAQLAWV